MKMRRSEIPFLATQDAFWQRIHRGRHRPPLRVVTGTRQGGSEPPVGAPDGMIGVRLLDMGDAVAERGRFRSTIRFWKPDQQGGLAVADIPADVAAMLGGLKQLKVVGSLNGAPFQSNTMPAGGGRLALSVSRKMLDGAGVRVGEEAAFEIERLTPA